MTDRKITGIRNNLITTYNRHLDELLSWCGSPIEKLMILQFYNHFTNYTFLGGHKRYEDPKFIIHHVDITDDEIEKARARMYNYVVNGIVYSKVIGFEVCIGSDPVPLTKWKKDSTVWKELEFYPQYEIVIDNQKYRADIAVIFNRKIGDDIIETKKLIIECDGYDYHSSKDQKKNDDIRSRALKRDGWKDVLRYSGSEIYSINDQEKFEDLLKEMMEIFDI